jgi:hypothetical protein
MKEKKEKDKIQRSVNAVRKNKKKTSRHWSSFGGQAWRPKNTNSKNISNFISFTLKLTETKILIHRAAQQLSFVCVKAGSR